MEFNQEENQEETGIKQWFQDNLRIIISVLVVVIIAGGIYSYSNRSVEIAKQEESLEQTDILQEITGDESAKTETAQAEENKQPNQNSQKENQAKAAPAAASQETDNSFIETAVRGDGSTKLARRALANYLEKNPDSSLTKEHKIYIEDYLRKNAAAPNGVHIGTSVEFSKNLIQDAISKSKNLNENQLRNLHKYVLRTPSLQ